MSNLILAGAWALARTPPDLAAAPAALPDDLCWVPATCPGTAAAALHAAGLWDGAAPLELDRSDIWYRTTIDGHGPHHLRFDGLATLSEIWLNGRKLAEHGSMFRPLVFTADLEPGILHIRFRSLLKSLEGKRGRPRWRPRMVQPPSLRVARTTLLGHMPGWCPTVQAVGPWRGMQAWALDGTPAVLDSTLLATLERDGSGTLQASIILAAPADAVLHIADQTVALDAQGVATITVPDVQPWWPHTHGTPHLYPVRLVVNGVAHDLGMVGFRRITVDHGSDGRGFAIRVNDQPVFCRGANWITPDLAALPSQADALRPQLERARDAGMTMLRVPGVGIYEADAFYALCDELGLLVWQDAMFANFHYPDDPAFLAEAGAEWDAFLTRTRGRACLAVLCGGSEIAQQAAMLGVPQPDRAHRLFDHDFAAIAARLRPDLPYVAHSPSSPDLPFLTDRGISHYYGVGAYQRPLEDARRADVRFATECLAFANVPDDTTIERAPGIWQIHDPRWKEGVPRDAGAAWDFEDVRDHYVGLLYGIDPARLRYEDPSRYFDLCRATVAEVIEAIFAEWRRPDSRCGGALVWTYQDLRPGAGWGVLDHLGKPKSAWYALRRASRPVQLSLTDEGLNGLAFHLLNETATPIEAELHLRCLADGHLPVMEIRKTMQLPPRSAQTIGSAALLPSFFDITHAYRFGPAAHDATVATLTELHTGRVLAEAFHFPGGRARPRADLGLTAQLHESDTGWHLRLRCTRVAQNVHIMDRYYLPEDAWFHMAPDREYDLPLTGATNALPEGEILALNSLRTARYESS